MSNVLCCFLNDQRGWLVARAASVMKMQLWGKIQNCGCFSVFAMKCEKVTYKQPM